MGQARAREDWLMLQDGDLRLRSCDAVRDVDAALPWYRDPEVLRMSEGTGALPFDRERVARMYLHLASVGELYMIEVRDETSWRTVGDVTLAQDTLPIVIGETNYRGRGLGGRVLDLLIGRAKALGWDHLQAKHVFTYNEPSRRLFSSRGFRPTERGVDAHGRHFVRYRLQLQDRERRA